MAALVALFSFLTTGSDKLFIVNWAIPSIMTLVILFFLKMIDRQDLLFLGGFITLGTVSGSLLYHFYPHVFNGVGVAIGPAGENAQALARMFRDFILFHPIISILFFLVGLGWILAFFRHLLKKDAEGTSFDPLMFFVILFLSGLITSFGTMVFSTYHIVDDSQMRYWLPFLLAPIFLAPLLIGTFLKNGRVPHVLSTALIGVIFLIQVMWGDSDHRWMQSYYPTPAACLDDALSSARVLRGVAPYWEARRYTFLSRLPGMEIAQVSDDLSPYLWINSDHDYDAPFRFAIVPKEGVSLEKSLRNKLGAPVSVRECQAFKVLFWTTPFYVRVQAGE